MDGVILSLDYDKTYTNDPAFWNAFVALSKDRGHSVVCVTMRRPDEAVTMPCPVIYTSRKAKAAHVADIGLTIDVWIDDAPHWINEDGA